jgi:signal transduction histidine kinase
MEEYLRRFLAFGRRPTRISERIDLRDLVDETKSLVTPAARHAGVDLQWVRPDASVIVEGDRLALEQLLINLLLNALQAASHVDPGSTEGYRAGGGRSSPPVAGRVIVEVGCEASAGAQLRVKDTGPGPPPHLHDKLFEPLVSDKPDGVGLGLSVARDVAQQHGGRLGWERQDGLTCFTLVLPQARPESAHVEAAGS